jgi:hypothetical protein
METATDRLAPYHHPHFVSVTPGAAGQQEFTFRDFTGREPQPELTDGAWDETITAEDRELLWAEYRRAYELWATARFQDKGRAQVLTMSPLRRAYNVAVDNMTAAFKSLESTDSASWRAQVMRVTRLHDAALEAAQEWDAAGATLAALHKEYAQAVGAHTSVRLEDLISGFGINTTDWEVHRSTAYGTGVTPAVAKVTNQVEQQEEQIRRVTELTGAC